MPSPQEKLANALRSLQKLQRNHDITTIKSSDLSPTEKRLLKSNGFIQEVLKGWYITSRPEDQLGDTTAWYMSYWNFVANYTQARFDKNWCLSPEQSLLLHSGNQVVPKQLLIRSPKANNNIVSLLHNTSILDHKLQIPPTKARVKINGLQLYTLEEGLVAVGPDFFTRHTTDARTCLSCIKDASNLLTILLNGGHSSVAGRLAGAFRNIGSKKIADNLLKTMKSAGYDIREQDPFAEKLDTNILSKRENSPFVNRIKLMWNQMRPVVLEHFPKAKPMPTNIEAFLKLIDDNYTNDAYHSLSIEGYKVTTDLIEHVQTGNWNPKTNEADKEARDAMAARGYFQAFGAVKESIREILEGENSGEIIEEQHGDWYRELFAPSVRVGLLQASDLAGYRNSQVYIKGSMHTPLPPNGVREAMPALFDLLAQEQEAAVRAVLGHFIFVYIHPYVDGNGRIARFLFNAMLASGGYTWTIVPVEQRNTYMAALEKASTEGDISSFARFLAQLVTQ